MNKILIIIQREYLSRVKNKRFLLTTILTPLLMVLFFVGATYFAIKGKEEHKIAVVDQNGFFKGNLEDSKHIRFEFPEGVDTSNYIKKGYTDILLIPEFKGTEKVNYIIRSKKRIGLTTEEAISRKIDEAIEDKMLQDAGIQRAQLDSIREKSQFAELKSLEEQGDSAKESNAALSYGIGFGSGMLIYITMFIYGAMVMRGVMEEKTGNTNLKMEDLRQDDDCLDTWFSSWLWPISFQLTFFPYIRIPVRYILALSQVVNKNPATRLSMLTISSQ